MEMYIMRCEVTNPGRWSRAPGGAGGAVGRRADTDSNRWTEPEPDETAQAPETGTDAVNHNIQTQSMNLTPFFIYNICSEKLKSFSLYTR